MKKTVFWTGGVILVVGIGLFAYGYTTIQNIIVASDPYPLASWFIMHPEAKQQWNLAHVLQPIGIGMLALGGIIFAYSINLIRE